MAHHREVNWNLPTFGDGLTWEHVNVAVLMDIRTELHRLNNILQCPNFLEILVTLSDIKRNTKRRKRVKK